MSRMDTIGTHRTTVSTRDGFTNVTYHATIVVSFSHDTIVLRTGGHETRTTKARMNQTSAQFDLGFSVYQKSYIWYVDYQGQTIEFTDGMTLTRSN